MPFKTRAAHLGMFLALWLPLPLDAAVDVVVIGDGLLADTSFNVRISGLTPGVGVTLSAESIDDTGRPWRSSARFYASDNGNVDLAGDYSVGGSYLGVDPQGLLWSLSPVPEADKPDYLRATATDPTARTTPALKTGGRMVVRLEARSDDGAQAAATFSRLLADPGVVIDPVHEGAVRGQFYRPPGEIRGAVLVLTGSGGGIDTRFGPLLASRGYLVLAQAYFGWDGVQPGLHDIPLEGFAEGVARLSREAGGANVVLMGTSRGSEAVQLTAIHFPDRVAGVIARVPSHVVNAAARSGVEYLDPTWLLGGDPLPYMDYDDGHDDLLEVFGTDPEGFRAADGYLKGWNALGEDSPKHIPVERLPGPLLIISGGADEVWPSAIAGDRIVQRLERTGFAHSFTHLRLAGAGHGIRLPGESTAFTRGFHPLGIFLRAGGTPESNARAARVAWRGTLEFLDQIEWRP